MLAALAALARLPQGKDIETDDEDDDVPDPADGGQVAGKKRKVGEAGGDLAGDAHPPPKKRAEEEEEDVEE